VATKGDEPAEKHVLLQKSWPWRTITKSGVRAITQKESISLDKCACVLSVLENDLQFTYSWFHCFFPLRGHNYSSKKKI
jgi:hypothetical protein